MKFIIDIPEDVVKRTVFYREFKDLNDCVTTIKALEKITPLDSVIADIELTKAKDKICEYPYNRCINIIKKAVGDES